MAIYECQGCESQEYVPRRFRYHFGPATRCPVCGSQRVSKLKAPDRIDKYHTGFLNLVERFVGKGMLFHCRWCRLQFFDRRPLASELAKLESKSKVLPAKPGTETPERVEKTADSA
jgi:DNA-directed RNA polymerase subunit RPC12/RpoP